MTLFSTVIPEFVGNKNVCLFLLQKVLRTFFYLTSDPRTLLDIIQELHTGRIVCPKIGPRICLPLIPVIAGTLHSMASSGEATTQWSHGLLHGCCTPLSISMWPRDIAMFTIDPRYSDVCRLPPMLPFWGNAFPARQSRKRGRQVL
jgi:hypothetical protein